MDNDPGSNNEYKKSEIHQHNRDMQHYMAVNPYITEQWRLTLMNF